MYADFERWVPGVFSNTPVHVRSGTIWVASTDENDEDDDYFYANTPTVAKFAAALIESAVLDELERRDIDIDILSSALQDDLNSKAAQVELWQGPFGKQVGEGRGPTRLHRLHAACKAAFGGG